MNRPANKRPKLYIVNLQVQLLLTLGVNKLPIDKCSFILFSFYVSGHQKMIWPYWKSMAGAMTSWAFWWRSWTFRLLHTTGNKPAGSNQTSLTPDRWTLQSWVLNRSTVTTVGLRFPYSASSEQMTPSSASPRPCSQRRRTAALVRSSLLFISRTARLFPGSSRRLCRAAGLGEATAKAGRRKKLRRGGIIYWLRVMRGSH